MVLFSDYFQTDHVTTSNVTITFHDPVLLKDVKALTKGTKLRCAIIDIHDQVVILIRGNDTIHTFNIKGVIEA